MMARGKIPVALAIFGFGLLVSASVAAQDFSYLLPGGQHHFEKVDVELYWSDNATPLVESVDASAIGATRDRWIGLIKSKPAIKQQVEAWGAKNDDVIGILSKLTFLVNIQLKAGNADISNFSVSPLAGNVKVPRPLRVRLAFTSPQAVPPRLVIVGEPTSKDSLFLAVLRTDTVDHATGQNYDVQIARDPLHANVIVLEVTRWPPGDPHVGG